jgi:hypothetical protein
LRCGCFLLETSRDTSTALWFSLTTSFDHWHLGHAEPCGGGVEIDLNIILENPIDIIRAVRIKTLPRPIHIDSYFPNRSRAEMIVVVGVQALRNMAVEIAELSGKDVRRLPRAPLASGTSLHRAKYEISPLLPQRITEGS